MPGALLRKLSATIVRERLFRRRDSILIAVSGGPDSVALLAALGELNRGGGWRIAAAHVNHGLRGRASDGDERFVAALASQLGVAFHALDGRIRDGADLEQRAREARYRRLHECAVAGRFRRIAVAHTQDDQAETLLFRLVRGAGSRGLAAMRFDRGDGVVRPMLECSREEVLAHLAAAGLGHRTDRSNRDLRFARNRIRHRVLPVLERELNPRARAALARAARLLGEDDDRLEREARSRLRRFAEPSSLDAGRLRRLPPALRRRVVRLWLADERDDPLAPTLDHVDAILRLAEESGSRSISIPGGTVRRSGAHLRFGRPEPEVVPADAILEPGVGRRFGAYRLTMRLLTAARAPKPTAWRAVFDAEGLDAAAPLRVRAPRPGDRIHPLGLSGSKKIQDLFVDAKLVRERRAAYPIIECGGRVLWVPGLARGDPAPLRARTRSVLVLECRFAERRRKPVALPLHTPYVTVQTGEFPRVERSGRHRASGPR